MFEGRNEPKPGGDLPLAAGVNGCGVDVGTAISHALAWMEVAAKADPAGLSDENLICTVKADQRLMPLAAGVSGHLGHDLASRREALVDLGLTVDQLFASELHEDRKAIRSRLNTTEIINRYYPDLDAALVEGRVSWSHCETFVTASNPRIHVELAEFQTLLIELAEATNF